MFVTFWYSIGMDWQLWTCTHALIFYAVFWLISQFLKIQTWRTRRKQKIYEVNRWVLKTFSQRMIHVQLILLKVSQTTVYLMDQKCNQMLLKFFQVEREITDFPPRRLSSYFGCVRILHIHKDLLEVNRYIQWQEAKKCKHYDTRLSNTDSH